jgi:hypothetical protein
MVQANSSILEVDVAGNLCERGFSAVHYTSEGAAPGIIAAERLRACVKANQVCIRGHNESAMACSALTHVQAWPEAR